MTFLTQPELVEGLPAACCPACGGRNLQSLGPVPEAYHFCAFRFRHPLNRSHLIRCLSCDLQFKNPCLSRAVLDDLYARQPDSVWGSVPPEPAMLARLFPLLENFPGETDIHVLDVGCYTGSLLCGLRDNAPAAYRIHPAGLEPSQSAANFARSQGVNILGTSVGDLADSGERFHLIVLTDVFEHILSGRDFLAPLVRVLRPGGFLVLLTGSTDSLPFRTFGSTYHYCAMPEHVAFLSRRHAEYLAGELRLRLVDYRLIFHSEHPPTGWKQRIKTLPYWLLKPLPLRGLMARFPSLLQPLVWERGLGVRNLPAQPDHAFAVFQNPRPAL